MGCRSRRRRPRRRDPVLTLPAVRVGIGGWDFAPWRGRFYPAGLPKSAELPYAAGRLTAIEINSTFYRTQTPENFAKWRDATPDGFSFAVKAARAAAYTRDQTKQAGSIAHFLGSGLIELGPKLGPILWQFPANRRFDAGEVAAFVAALPRRHAGVSLRHVIEAKHASFDSPHYASLLADHNVADCLVETMDQPARVTLTADFGYLRLQRTQADAPDGYDAAELDRWAAWIDTHAPRLPGGIHAFFISGAKERAPDAAQALIARLTQS